MSDILLLGLKGASIVPHAKIACVFSGTSTWSSIPSLPKSGEVSFSARLAVDRVRPIRRTVPRCHLYHPKRIRYARRGRNPDPRTAAVLDGPLVSARDSAEGVAVLEP
jgi:hypothetical protein